MTEFTSKHVAETKSSHLCTWVLCADDLLFFSLAEDHSHRQTESSKTGSQARCSLTNKNNFAYKFLHN